MPYVEYGITPKDLAQFSEFHVAPRNQRVDVEQLHRRCHGYEIAEPAPPFEHPQDDLHEYFYQTKSEGNIRIRHHHTRRKRYEYVNGNMREMEQVETTLAKSQSFDLPHPRSKSGIHAAGMHFIIENLDVMDEILTNNNGRRKTSRNPRWFIENDIPHPTKEGITLKSDLILVGSDNRFRILEFGNQVEKTDKVQKYASGLQLIYERTTQSHLPPNRIIPYVVRYRQEEDAFALDLYPQQYR